MNEALNKLKGREDEWDAKILSNLILMNRVNRPDEWTMDDFARMALELEEEQEYLSWVYENALAFIKGRGMADTFKEFYSKEEKGDED